MARVADKLDRDAALAALEKRKKGQKLTRAEIKAIGRYEKQRQAKRSAELVHGPKPAKPAYPRRASISAKYRPHLPAIAEVYVATGHNATRTAQIVRDRLKRLRFRAAYIKRWMGAAEFAALVRAEEERQTVENVASPFVRGPETIGWLVNIERCLREKHDATEKVTERAVLLGARHKVAAEVRAEELFLSNLKVARARQSLGRMLKNMLRLAKEAGAAPNVWRFLEHAFAKLDKLLGGASTELVDAEAIILELTRRLADAGEQDRVGGNGEMKAMSDEQLLGIVGRADEVSQKRKAAKVRR